MHDARRGRRKGRAAEDLVLRTIAAHADALLRTARRYSLCPDDAQDAYQRALEIFMRHAGRLDPERAAAWLHVVVKREAHAVREARQRVVAGTDLRLDDHEARTVPTPDEHLATFDLIGRSAEALKRLKPQELRALWLRAQGHSYNEICDLTGWSYTKVNRCLTEGRKSFLARYAEIESGAECERWMPVISALVDGEATPESLADLRPHLRNCPGCRATLRALQESSAPLSAVLPIPLAAVTTDVGEHLSTAITRAYEMVAGGLHDRAATSLVKVQAAVETATAGKAAAIAGAAAAVATGSYATVERTLVERPVKSPPAQKVEKARPSSGGGSRVGATQPGLTKTAIVPTAVQRRTVQASKEFMPARIQRGQAETPEFRKAERFAASASSAPQASRRQSIRAPSPEFARSPKAPSNTSPEFGP